MRRGRLLASYDIKIQDTAPAGMMLPKNPVERIDIFGSRARSATAATAVVCTRLYLTVSLYNRPINTYIYLTIISPGGCASHIKTTLRA